MSAILQTTLRTSLLLAAGIGLVPACAPLRPRPEAFEPTERWLVMRGEGAERLEVVTNDKEAGDFFLHTPSAPVRPDDPVLPRLQARMRETVLAEQGVGIAAPQVGLSRRLIWVQRVDQPDKPFVFYSNPRIVSYSEQTVVDWEGCLSVPAGFGKVRRAARIVLRTDRPGGGEAEETVEGFAARIFQHEIDHLDGVLFVDRMEPGELLPRDAYREMRRREKEAASSAGSPPPAK